MYYYEGLDGVRFQKLAQALIVAEHPNTQCLPVPQPDGGRDAFAFHDTGTKSEFVVFQVKFSQNPKSKDQRELIKEIIKKEKEKVIKLIEKGASEYVLITNISGTAHLERGSIDKINKLLQKELKIPSSVWWRDDLDARLNNASDIKWSFPDILRGTDVLQKLLTRPENTPDEESTKSVAAYVGRQYGDDRDLKFKQIELSKNIINLFVDLPIGLKNNSKRGKGDIGTVQGALRKYLAQLADNERLFISDDAEDEIAHSLESYELAAAFLMHMPYHNGVSRLVLEGAPGQGKSTVTQFICQANRLKLMQSRTAELSQLNKAHLDAPTRTPFRIDLRDFASWVFGRQPYAGSSESVPQEGQRSLESFLTMQIKVFSGGLNITQYELLKFFENAHCLIVLDGFDEVADVATREKVVKEICAASNRFEANSLSLQIIVTSRPTAFANSPGFPEDDWAHLELTDLEPQNIDAYRSKWGAAMGLSAAERSELEATLNDKLEHPHLRDLSRNPMQLAILLQLMHVQGAALPDKRTALYEEYMKIFLNREVEKKQIESGHRDLILAIHGSLAWLLQKQAELNEGAGSITEDELREAISTYLSTEEYPESLAEKLLKGTTERVGVLVSRLQGAYEFEVQPLREFFAARHLKHTTPYTPANHQISGTLPDRFSALAHSFYWTNVTRFFCGFYSRGELESIVQGIFDLSEEADYRLINQPRHLTAMLLADYVFSEAPKTMRRLVDFMLMEPGFSRFTKAGKWSDSDGFALPEAAGRELLFKACVQRISTENDPFVRTVLRRVIQLNASPAELKKLWYERFNSGVMLCDPMIEAFEFDIISLFSLDEVKNIFGSDHDRRLQWLLRAGEHQAIVADEMLYSRAQNALFNAETYLMSTRSVHQSPKLPLAIEVISTFLHPYVLSKLTNIESIGYADQALRRFSGNFMNNSALTKFMNNLENRDDKHDPLDDFAVFILRELKTTKVVDWQVTLAPWSNIIDKGLKIQKQSRLLKIIAVLSTAVDLSNERYIKSRGSDSRKNKKNDPSERVTVQREAPRGVWGEDGFELTEGLVQRLYYAREQASNINWWKAQLSKIEANGLVTLISVLVNWGTENTLVTLKDELIKCVDVLDDNDWEFIKTAVRRTTIAARYNKINLDKNCIESIGGKSPRLGYLLSYRAEDSFEKRKIGRLCFAGYHGTDFDILRRAVEWEALQDNDDEIDWAYIKCLSKRLNLLPSHNRGFMEHIGKQLSIIPYEEAKDVLLNYKHHDSFLVIAAERLLTSSIGQKADKVSKVAQNEGWFISRNI